MPGGSTRSAALAGLLAFVVGPAAGCATTDAPDASPAPSPSRETVREAGPERPATESDRLEGRFRRLEEEFDARLGVHAVDTGTGREIGHRSGERFAYASTFKPLACGAVMRRHSMAELEETVTYGAGDLVAHSPVSEERVGTGMSLLEACDAAIRHSDNTAATLLIDALGGPDGFREALRGLGDDTTEVAREEPGPDGAASGDPRATSTPEALAAGLRAYVLDDTLPEGKRELLREMLLGSTTGDGRIRAGVPDGWEVGDKTGTMEYATCNDIAVVWPPEGGPIVLAILSDRDRVDAAYDEALIAEATTVVTDALRP